jgi:hypothetical protein
MALVLFCIPCRAVASPQGDGDLSVINMEPGEVMLEFVGQMVDLPTDLPRSNQFGFLSFVKGIEHFTPASLPFDRTTAEFGFFTQATTTRGITNGPLVIISREGTTRIYFTPCPLCLSPSVDFASADASIPVFPIQSSTLRQQLIINSETRSFMIVNVNTINETRPFNLGGHAVSVGRGRTDF